METRKELFERYRLDSESIYSEIKRNGLKIMAEKERLDVLIVNKGLAASRELAKAYIMAGNVYVDGNKEDKAGTKVEVDSAIEIRGGQMPYVSRGGFKLEKAMEVFPVSLNGKICMDIGASTGGFTDCMLQNGASKVYSIDVGYGPAGMETEK